MSKQTAKWVANEWMSERMNELPATQSTVASKPHQPVSLINVVVAVLRRTFSSCSSSSSTNLCIVFDPAHTLTHIGNKWRPLEKIERESERETHLLLPLFYPSLFRVSLCSNRMRPTNRILPANHCGDRGSGLIDIVSPELGRPVVTRCWSCQFGSEF